jgi:predicted RND superfamily exporter protein
VLLWTLGAMGHLGVPITLVTTILPIVLMTMAVTDEVHLLERFQARLAAEPADDATPDPSTRKRRAMHGAIGDVGRPIVLTSVTTAIGFLSFLSASMDPIRHFGLFGAIGIVIAMLLRFSFVPALAMLLPAAYFETPRFPSSRPGPPRGPDPPGTRLWPHERLLIRRSRAAAWCAGALVLVALPGLARLTVQDSWVDNFDPASDLVSAERDFNAEFWGSYRLDITLHSDQVRFFQYHEGLTLMEKVREAALAGAQVAGVESHLIAFEAVAKAIDEPGALSALPHSVILRIVVLVWTVRDAIGLDQVLAWGGQSARARLYVNSADHLRAEALRDHLERELPSIVEPFPVRYHLGGELAVASEVVGSIVSNQIRSIAWALLGVALLLWLTLRSAQTAGLLIAPLAAALLTLLGAMGYFDVSLGIATSMFTALALGVGVDFALHFHHAYERQSESGRDHEAALSEALRSSGRAIRWNATVLSLGFLVLTASALKPNHSLGVLLSAAIAACYAMTLLLLPHLLRRARSPGSSPWNQTLASSRSEADATRAAGRSGGHERMKSGRALLAVAVSIAALVAACSDDTESANRSGVADEHAGAAPDPGAESSPDNRQIGAEDPLERRRQAAERRERDFFAGVALTADQKHRLEELADARAAWRSEHEDELNALRRQSDAARQAGDDHAGAARQRAERARLPRGVERRTTRADRAEQIPVRNAARVRRRVRRGSRAAPRAAEGSARCASRATLRRRRAQRRPAAAHRRAGRRATRLERAEPGRAPCAARAAARRSPGG